MYRTTMLAALIAAAPVVQAAQNHPAQQQVQQNIDAVMGIVKNKSLNEEQRIRRVEQYADRFLDYERLSATAVGLPWRQFSAAQKQEFIRAFKNMIIAMYARSAMMNAERAEVKVLPKMTTHGNKTDVYSEIVTPLGQEIRSGLPALPKRQCLQALQHPGGRREHRYRVPQPVRRTHRAKRHRRHDRRGEKQKPEKSRINHFSDGL